MEPQTGSFGNIAPDGMQAIKDALARRSGGDQVPALNTQSGASPTQSPLPPEAQGSMPSAQMPSPEALPQPSMGNPEAKLIISALRERLKAISTVEGGIPQKGMI